MKSAHKSQIALGACLLGILLAWPFAFKSRTDVSPPRKLAAVRKTSPSIAAIKDSRAVPPLIQLLEHEELRIRRHDAWALKQFPGWWIEQHRETRQTWVEQNKGGGQQR